MPMLEKILEGESLLPEKRTSYSLRTKLLLYLIPSVVLILVIVGFITYLTSSRFLNTALGRSAQIQVRAIGHEIESVLTLSGRDLRYIAQADAPLESRKHFANLLRLRDIDYREFGFISRNDRSHEYFVASRGEIVRIAADAVAEIRPNPLGMLPSLVRLKPGEVWVSPIMEAEHPFPVPSNPNQTLRSEVIYFATPYVHPESSRSGYLLLSLDMRVIRNILSLYNSSRSPIWSFPRTPEVRFAYLFDLHGWVLFQSEDPEAREAGLGTELVRISFPEGMLGTPGFPTAYRPASSYQVFWKMVGDVREGRYGIVEASGPPPPGATRKDYFLAYTPIRFEGRTVAGVAYSDRTRLFLAAGYRHLDIMLILALVTIVITSLIIYLVSHVIAKPIYRLAAAVDRNRRNRVLEPIEVLPTVYEELLLQQSINGMINAIKSQMAEIRQKNLKIQDTQLKQRAPLGTAASGEGNGTPEDILPEIVGYGERIERFKSDVLKAAGAEADVLIIGETGTGKQLTAEAIHRHSRRSEKPFFSINCGELSENLLLDTLFGHVRGAFTEAKTDRKGAFLEAQGGTLFLDEIQTASLNVQQALLRALSVRKIKPLGSDREIDVNVRLITATNIDLRTLIEQGGFRSDLYFRLKVITLHTPSLRDHRENIPVLIEHFLRQLRRDTGRDDLGVSRGALEKMKQYDWPGNVREVMNTITRAAVMTESDVIQASEIQLEGDDLRPGENGPGPASLPPTAAAGSATPATEGALSMNDRQRKVYPAIVSRKMITRNEYQRLSGGNVSARTANYDLQDLVKKGFLRREGSGPSTRYRLVE